MSGRPVILDEDDVLRIHQTVATVLGDEGAINGIDRRRTHVEARASEVLVAHFEVVGIFPDHLACKRHNPKRTTFPSKNVNVARPHLLQQSEFDGQTINYPGGQSISYTYLSHRQRIANDGTESETQEITPDYFFGDIITAIRITGVESGGSFLRWQDLNHAGRAWAAIPEVSP